MNDKKTERFPGRSREVIASIPIVASTFPSNSSYQCKVVTRVNFFCLVSWQIVLGFTEFDLFIKYDHC